MGLHFGLALVWMVSRVELVYSMPPAPDRTREKDNSALSNTTQSSKSQTLSPSISAPSAMVLKIRLARFGKRNAPFYNIVVAQARYAISLFPLFPYLQFPSPPPNTQLSSQNRLTYPALHPGPPATPSPSKSSAPTTRSQNPPHTARANRSKT